MNTNNLLYYGFGTLIGLIVSFTLYSQLNMLNEIQKSGFMFAMGYGVMYILSKERRGEKLT